MTTVFFIRHGLTAENQEGRIQGQSPGTLLIPETERYLASITPLLRKKKINLILSSDLKRAMMTRDILKKFLEIKDLKEGVSVLLREKAMGFYEGMLWSQVPTYIREGQDDDSFDFRSFGGENTEDVRHRVREALREFAMRYSNMHICCVTHAGWLKQLVHLADSEGILPNQWSDRSAIYEAGIGPIGQLKYFHPVVLKGDIEFAKEKD